jgi:hypothetical protein
MALAFDSRRATRTLAFLLVLPHVLLIRTADGTPQGHFDGSVSGGQSNASLCQPPVWGTVHSGGSGAPG